MHDQVVAAGNAVKIGRFRSPYVWLNPKCCCVRDERMSYPLTMDGYEWALVTDGAGGSAFNSFTEW